MANTSGIKAGRTYVELGVGDKLPEGLRKAQARLRAFGAGMQRIGSRMMMIGAAAAAPLAAAVKVFSSAGDTLHKMSKRTGMTTEALSELGFAAERSGTDLGSLENGLKRMQRSIYDAGRGLSTATEALADLGLTTAALEGLAPEQQFTKLAGALARVADPSRKAALAMTLFGRSGTELIPMIERGEAGLEELREKARALGLTVSGDTAAAAAKLTDRMADLWATAKRAAMSVGQALGPAIEDLAKWLTDTAVGVRAWIDENRELLVTGAKVVAAVTAIGAGLVIAGKVIGVATAAVTGLTVALTFLAAHPVVAAFAAIAAAGMYLGMAFKALSSATKEANDQISKALDAGDAKRKADREQFQRLRQLAEQSRRTNAEMYEAETILGHLTSRYGDLGISVDKATGKIAGLAKAQKLLNEELQKREMLQLNAAIHGAKQEVNAATEDIQSNWLPFAESEQIERRDKAFNKLQELLRRRAKLRNQQGTSWTAKAGAPQAEALEASRKLAELQEQEAAKRRTRAEEEIAEIRKIAAEKHRLFGILGQEAEQIAAAKDAEAQIAAVRKREQDAANADRIAAAKQLSADLERLEIEASLKGRARERALLALERKHELAEAEKLGLDLVRVNEKFDLQRRILAGADTAARATSARVTFGDSALGGLGSGAKNEQKRTREAAEKTNQVIQEMSDNLSHFLDRAMVYR